MDWALSRQARASADASLVSGTGALCDNEAKFKAIIADLTAGLQGAVGS
jgi:hypothetical protein